MPQRPTHRLNLYLVPQGGTADPEALLSALADWGVLAGMKPGPRAEEFVDGGFALLRVDRPGRELLYGNRQGGFRVRCPDCGANLVAAFSEARAKDAEVTCDACGGTRDHRALTFLPDVAFGELAVELRDVGAPSLTAHGEQVVRRHLGAFSTIGSRG